MTEFRRILDGGDNDAIALALLRSTEEDEPDGAALLATATALGVGAAFVTTAASSANVLGAGLVAKEAALAGASATSTAGALALKGAALATAAAPATSLSLLAMLVKPLAIGLLTGVAAVTGLSYVSDAPAPVRASHGASPAEPRPELPNAPTPAARAAVPAEADTELHAPANADDPKPRSLAQAAPGAEPSPWRDALPAPRSEAAQPAKQDGAPATLPTASFALVPQPASTAPLASAATAQPAAVAPAASELTQRLAREVALLDRARSALNRKDASGALRALSEYSRSRPSGNFEQEATVLRIKALFEVGDRAGAARLAKSFVAKHPESRHSAWLRTLAE